MADVDVVVVGAGSAGAVLAARLSEDPGRSVLLLEAGPDHRSADTPAAIAGPNMHNALGVPGRVFPDLTAVSAPGQPPEAYLRGRGVGGGTAVDAMVAMRGIPQDYDRWAHELGCRGWSWEEFRPWLLGVEDDLRYGADAWHGKGGAIPLDQVPIIRWSRLELAVARAADDLGYPWCDDYHQPGAVGFGPAALTIRGGRRTSTNDAYLEPARDRPNLTVRGDTLVDRVLFAGRRAVGVRTADGAGITAARVVLAAGAIHSPAILLRSGVAERPVGENLVEQPLFTLSLTFDERHRAHFDRVRPMSTVLRYTSGVVDAGPADMQLVTFAPAGPQPVAAGTPVTGMIGVVAGRVFSRGRLGLAGDSPHVQPRIEFGMLSDERDAVRMRDGFGRAVQLARHEAVAALTTSVTAAGTPLDRLRDPDALDAWMRASVRGSVHPAGTCRMGAVGDPAAVVDPECRLIGYRDTYVVDASVMPDVPRANTNLTVVALAERIADRLRHR